MSCWLKAGFELKHLLAWGMSKFACVMLLLTVTCLSVLFYTAYRWLYAIEGGRSSCVMSCDTLRMHDLYDLLPWRGGEVVINPPEVSVGPLLQFFVVASTSLKSSCSLVSGPGQALN